MQSASIMAIVAFVVIGLVMLCRRIDFNNHRPLTPRKPRSSHLAKWLLLGLILLLGGCGPGPALQSATPVEIVASVSLAINVGLLLAFTIVCLDYKRVKKKLAKAKDDLDTALNNYMIKADEIRSTCRQQVTDIQNECDKRVQNAVDYRIKVVDEVTKRLAVANKEVEKLRNKLTAIRSIAGPLADDSCVSMSDSNGNTYHQKPAEFVKQWVALQKSEQAKIEASTYDANVMILQNGMTWHRIEMPRTVADIVRLPRASNEVWNGKRVTLEFSAQDDQVLRLDRHIRIMSNGQAFCSRMESSLCPTTGLLMRRVEYVLVMT